MKSFAEFIVEAEGNKEADWVKGVLSDRERIAKAQSGEPSPDKSTKRKRVKLRRPPQASTPQTPSREDRVKQAFDRGRQKVSDLTQRAKDKAATLRDAVKRKQELAQAKLDSAKEKVSRTKQKLQDAPGKLKDNAKKVASKVANATPKDVARKAKELGSDAKTKLKYGRVIKPNSSSSALVKTSSALTKVSKFSKGLRAAGRAVGPAAAALDVAAEKSKGSGWLRSLAKGAVTAAGGAAGAAAGSAAGPVGTVAGGAAGATAASKAFDVAAGKNAKERAADRVKNRKRQAGGALVGTGGKTTFDTKKNTMTTGGKTVNLRKTSVVTDPKTGKKETGHLAYKDGKAVYKRADKPGTGTSNPFERIGRAINPNAYKANDAKLAAEKLKKAQANDAARNKDLGIKPKK